MPTNIDAYAAGLIDGDGCITIWTGGRRFRALTVVTVALKEPTKAALGVLEAHYGGKVFLSHRSRNGAWAMWAWRVCGAQAETVLERVVPHLIIKQSSARLALQLEKIRRLRTKGPRKEWTQSDRFSAQRLIREIRAANRSMPLPIENEIARRVGGRWMNPQGGTLFGTDCLAPFCGTWPTAGRYQWGSVFSMHNTSECLNAAEGSSLSQILEADVQEKYSLSPKACAGILRRAQRRGKTLPTALAAALAAVAGATN